MNPVDVVLPDEGAMYKSPILVFLSLSLFLLFERTDETFPACLALCHAFRLRAPKLRCAYQVDSGLIMNILQFT